MLDAGPTKTSTKTMNLTDLADRYGSDKGTIKHRYTELYHMLFNPFRHRKINFLEMGLLIGGPEHGVSAGRETRDLPSVRKISTSLAEPEGTITVMAPLAPSL